MKTDGADLGASCCSSLSGAGCDTQAFEHLAQVLRAIADPTRLHLLSLIASSPDQQACICHLTGPVGLSQPTVSHHMKLLVEAGLVTREQRGKWAFYAIIPAAFDNLASAVAAAPTRT